MYCTIGCEVGRKTKGALISVFVGEPCKFIGLCCGREVLDLLLNLVDTKVKSVLAVSKILIGEKMSREKKFYTV